MKQNFKRTQISGKRYSNYCWNSSPHHNIKSINDFFRINWNQSIVNDRLINRVFSVQQIRFGIDGDQYKEHLKCKQENKTVLFSSNYYVLSGDYTPFEKNTVFGVRSPTQQENEEMMRYFRSLHRPEHGISSR